MSTDLEALGLAVKRAQYRNHRTMDAALREVGVTLVQWDALRAVERGRDRHNRRNPRHPSGTLTA